MSIIYLEAKKETVLGKNQIVRGPYLQLGTESSIIIRWATDAPNQSIVWYGTTPNRLDLMQQVTKITCDHQVKLTGLIPETKYYYAVGTGTEVLVGKTEDYFFTTSPSQTSEPEETGPIQIWVLGDAGRGNDIAASVRDGYLKFASSRHADLWLMLGDNAYEDGTYQEYQKGIFDTYPQILRSCVLWTAIGNHDGGSANSKLQTGPYYELFTLPLNGEAGGVPSNTAAYYSFDYGNIHFICLDSYDSERSCEGTMLTWLKQDLASTSKDWKIAFWHHPPYTKGSHDSDDEFELIEMREHALPILENAGVDLVMCGHSHSYERSYLIDGHYGSSNTFTQEMKKDGGSGREDGEGAYQKPLKSSNGGTVYIVAGTSAFADDVFPHPAMHTSLSIPGSLILDVQGKRLDAKFIDSQGEVRDYFTIKKTL
jgi:acid phosphatase type 7